MPRLRVLHAEQWLPQRPEEVFPFFADAHNLAAITPPWLRFAVLAAGPPRAAERQQRRGRAEPPAPRAAMAVGTEIDYRLRVRGVPLRWRSRIVAWDPPRGFTDVQVRGPYAAWRHEHGFAARDGGTLVTDRVELVPPGGPLGELAFRWLIRRDVLGIFRYRAGVLAERFGGDAGAARVWFAPTADDRPSAAR